MPIRILFLPLRDISYALRCMGIGELVAFSLCSNRTKNLVKPLHKKRGNIFAEVRESGISLDIRLWTYQGYQSLVLLLNSSSSLVKLEQGNKCWRKQGFTQSDWVAHFMNIFDKYEIQKLQINNASLCHLDTVKQIIPKCQIILIREQCSAELTKTAFLKLAPIAKKVQINNNPFDMCILSVQLMPIRILSLPVKDLHSAEVNKGNGP
ncbi:hypothetical protein L5515_009307 [Caenorhabditis briggsae]|uniref:F-box domain-containing protein n=1 Tax=Caenorhabditis briggsae TaxID=6238 RepID=A0AAE9F8H2_CAEBR|nr:hypothetical protein L5515_009307 [Caenorhabditis briggsae]